MHFYTEHTSYNVTVEDTAIVHYVARLSVGRGSRITSAYLTTDEATKVRDELTRLIGDEPVPTEPSPVLIVTACGYMAGLTADQADQAANVLHNLAAAAR